jgi:hypothetical protein
VIEQLAAIELVRRILEHGDALGVAAGPRQRGREVAEVGRRAPRDRDRGERLDGNIHARCVLASLASMRSVACTARRSQAPAASRIASRPWTASSSLS